MVCDEGVGLIMVIKRAKILKIKGCAASLCELRGRGGGFVEGVHADR